VDDAQFDGFGAARERHAGLGDIVAAHGLDRALAIHSPHGAADALPVQEALHRRQEGDELVVMPLLEFGGVAELVVDLAPRTAVAVGQMLPVLQLVAGLERQQIDRPEQDLAQMPHARGVARARLGALGDILLHDANSSKSGACRSGA
jgi:hypothetical protein